MADGTFAAVPCRMEGEVPRDGFREANGDGDFG